MSEYMFGVTTKKPTRKQARQWDKVCRNEGGFGFTEVNVSAVDNPGVNNGQYQGWFTGPNRGEPFDSQLRARVMARIGK